jgi:signal transduction histidine kinase
MTIGFKIAAAYSALFTCSFLALALFAYFMIDTTLAIKDREMIEREVQSLRSRYEAGGWNGFYKAVVDNDRFRKNNPFFIREIKTKDHSGMIFFPRYWKDFDLNAIQDLPPPLPETWARVLNRKGTYGMELYTAQNPDGSLFQVGISAEDRLAVLRQFREAFLSISVPLLLLAAAGGALLSRRTLHPLRNLIVAVASIEAGKMDAAVPMTQNGDELDELGKLFNRMIRKVDHLIRAMKGSLDSVAHDLRTPMTRFRNTAEAALQRNSSAESLREALHECVEESERILQKLRMLMDISEAETGTMQLHLRRADLVQLANGVVEMYRFVAEETEICIETDFPTEAPLEVDADRISQVMANLLDNAVKYTRRGGTIRVKIENLPDSVQVTITDSGIGIEPEEIPKIWDRLYRGKHSKHKGLGLGLSLVRAVVHAHQGTIRVSSTQGTGSTFVMQLPAGAKTESLAS